MTLPALRQDVHTFTRFGVPPTTVRTRWMFGLHRRLARTCECETLYPKLGCLPQISQVAATVTPDDEARCRATAAETQHMDWI